MAGAQEPTLPRRPPLRLATRRSPLALIQARAVADKLGGHVTLVEIETVGDRRRDRPIEALGAPGAFVREVQAAVLEGRADVAVHSAKDLPSASAAGLTLAAVPERQDPRDVLVGATLSSLGSGAAIATGAPRRRAQLAWLRPDLRFVALRGNIGTRLGRVPPGGAVVVAAAALERLGLHPETSQRLSADQLLPQAGQGALALECRSGDEATKDALGGIDCQDAHRCYLAERAVLAALGAGCEAPVGALATVEEDGTLLLTGVLASRDGHSLVRRRARGREAAALGGEVARALAQAADARLMPASRSGAPATA